MTSLDHHAYLLSGQIGETPAATFFKEREILAPKNAEIVHRVYDTLGIDDARALFDLQLRRTGDKTATIFLIETSFITREAQNAMLKMLEEPSPNTYFIVVTPHPELLLSTLRSRLSTLTTKVVSSDLSRTKTFVDGAYQERQKIVTSLLEEGNRSEAEQLLKGVVMLLHSQQAPVQIISQIDRLRRYVTDTSSSLKMILEYVVYALPA